MIYIKNGKSPEFVSRFKLAAEGADLDTVVQQALEMGEE
jgi:hypothetical protein